MKNLTSKNKRSKLPSYPKARNAKDTKLNILCSLLSRVPFFTQVGSFTASDTEFLSIIKTLTHSKSFSNSKKTEIYFIPMLTNKTKEFYRFNLQHNDISSLIYNLLPVLLLLSKYKNNIKISLTGNTNSISSSKNILDSFSIDTFKYNFLVSLKKRFEKTCLSKFLESIDVVIKKRGFKDEGEVELVYTSKSNFIESLNAIFSKELVLDINDEKKVQSVNVSLISTNFHAKTLDTFEKECKNILCDKINDIINPNDTNGKEDNLNKINIIRHNRKDISLDYHGIGINISVKLENGDYLTGECYVDEYSKVEGCVGKSIDALKRNWDDYKGVNKQLTNIYLILMSLLPNNNNISLYIKKKASKRVRTTLEQFLSVTFQKTDIEDFYKLKFKGTGLVNKLKYY